MITSLVLSLSLLTPGQNQNKPSIPDQTDQVHTKPSALGQSPDKPSMIGLHVVQKNLDFRLWREDAGDRKYFEPKFLYTYKIIQINLDTYFLQVEGTGIEGLANKDDVVFDFEMVAFFSMYIKRNPNDPWGYSRRSFGLQEKGLLKA